MDRRLYKYCPVNKNTLSIFINSALYLPTTNKFNDPFDGQLLPSHFVSEMQELDRIGILSSIYVQDASIQDRINKYGVLSLSKKNDNILMWSHYAQAHQGICIGFDNIESCFNNHDWPIWEEDVEYINDHPFKNTYEKLHNGIDYNSYDDFANICRFWYDLESAAFKIKHIDWKYEQEVRIISHENGSHSILEKAISCVILGLNISKDDENIVRSILSFPKWRHVKIYRAKRGKGALSLEIVKDE